MNVFFSRSLRDDLRPDQEIVYKGIVNAIKSTGHKPQFEIPVSIPKVDLTSEQYIYRRDLAWIDQCQALVAEVSNVSHGVGYEIAYAKHVRKIPIFCVCQKDHQVSAMIAGDLDVLHYEELADLIPALQTFLASIIQMKQE